MRLLLFALLSAAVLAAFCSFGCAAVDSSRDLTVRWPNADERTVALLAEAGIQALVTDRTGGRRVIEPCRKAGIVPIAELESAASPEDLDRSAGEARAGGFAGIAYASFCSEEQVRAFAARQASLFQFVYVNAGQLRWRTEPAHAVLRAGQWPGVQLRDPSVASASEAPWVDSNIYLVAYLRGMFPDRAAVLGYRPDADAGAGKDRMLPFESVELAVIEALAAGGNIVLTLPDRFALALSEGKPQALAAWSSLAKTITFLRQHRGAFQAPVASRVAIVAGSLERDGELLNMMYRGNLSPAIAPERAIPALRAQGIQLLVLNGGGTAEAGRAALEFARAGGHVLAAPASEKESGDWLLATARKAKDEADHSSWAAGAGVIVFYKSPIGDPAEFVLDVTEKLGWSSRDLRLWNAPSAIGVLHRLPAGRLSVELVNYGSPVVPDLMVRVEGSYPKAVLHAPGAVAVPLKPLRRAGGTEIIVPSLERFARIELE